MTIVRIDLRRGDFTSPVVGTVSVTPYRRLHVDGAPDHITLPDPIVYTLVDGKIELDLRPNDGTWVWVIAERVPHGTTRYVNVPASVTPVDYGDLVDIDPKTLAPMAHPEAAWWVALQNILVPPTTPTTPTTPALPAVTSVKVITGAESRPASANLVFWIGGTVKPTNMIDGDIWVSPATVVTPPVDPEDPEEPEEPEEPTDPGTPASYLSVFGTASPGATSEAHGDGGGSLVVGDRFYSTKTIRVRGARLWNPPTADGTFLTRPVVFNAYGEDWVSEGLMTTVPAGSPTATKTFTGQRVAGTWTEVLFDTPILINPVASAANGADTITITVNMEGTHYVTTSLATSNEDAVRSTMDSGTYLAEMTFRRAVANVSIQPFAYYGVDILFEVV